VVGLTVSRNYIDFISSYCDRWCERCAFTDRCSARAVEIAAGMCGGDFEAGLQLAVGRAATPGEPAGRPVPEMPNEEPTGAERARMEQDDEAREARIDESPVTTQATIALMLSRRWVAARRRGGETDPALSEAVDIVEWDAYLIPAKLHRALNGRDEAKHGESLGDDHPVQNDWNGSAKVALISIERSLAACRRVAEATGDPEAAHVTDALAHLREAVEAAFPNARQFVRPGFDDGGRRRRWWS
jgi:hypothetical protein